MAHHAHRHARLGAQVLIRESWYYSPIDNTRRIFLAPESKRWRSHAPGGNSSSDASSARAGRAPHGLITGELDGQWDMARKTAPHGPDNNARASAVLSNRVSSERHVAVPTFLDAVAGNRPVAAEGLQFRRVEDAPVDRERTARMKPAT